MASKNVPWCSLLQLPLVLPGVSLRRVGLWFLCPLAGSSPVCLVFLKLVLSDIYVSTPICIYIYLVLGGPRLELVPICVSEVPSQVE